MLELHYTNQMKRDLRIVRKRGKNLNKLKTITDLLQQKKPLPAKHQNHKLSGDYKDHWECHVEPDWLLIYLITSCKITLVRTGTHSELF
ncbi:MAG: type II toxin-antitoxin system YafQ family toxin [Chlamydiia bacterium]|nr:type II toxin-antitoxin system YafQ family toxin [Chlamydiia bacterium]